METHHWKPPCAATSRRWGKMTETEELDLAEATSAKHLTELATLEARDKDRQIVARKTVERTESKLADAHALAHELQAEVERLRALLDRACQTARTGEVWGMDHVREAEGVCKDIYK